MKAKKGNDTIFYLKYITFAISFVLVAYAMCMGGVSLWVLLSKSEWTAMMSDQQYLKDGAILLITASSLFFLSSIIACFSSILQTAPGLYLSAAANIIVVILMFTGGILGLTSRMQNHEELRGKMEMILMNAYGKDPYDLYHVAITDLFDGIQREEECCGVRDESWSLYKNSNWYEQQPGIQDGTRPLVPESCCVIDQNGQYLDKPKCQTYLYGPPTRLSGMENHNEALYYRGCLGSVWTLLRNKSEYIGGMGVASGIILLPVIVLYIFLGRKLR